MRRRTRRLAILALLAVPGLAGCGLAMPPGPTDQSREIASLYQVVFVIAVTIFLLVEGLIVWSVIRYRRKPGDDELPPQIDGNIVAEIVWTVVPLVIVVFLFGISWQTLNRVDAVTGDPSLTVDVTAFQFQWQFAYPAQGVTIVGTPDKPAQMVVPVDEAIRINLTSSDVIHAFYVPAFNFKRDAIPGQVNTFEFTVREPGTYPGQCAELCGVGHWTMLLSVRAVSTAEFDAWAKSAAAPSAAPSGSPGASPSAGGSAAPAGPVFRIAAKSIAFDQAQLTAPAGTPFQIVFNNQDGGVPHNIAIYTDSSAGTAVFKGDIFPGPAERTYSVPALKAGRYFFRCDVHPSQMSGTLVVQ